MRVAVLAITSMIVLAWGGSESAVANGNNPSTPSSMTAGEIKPAPGQSVKKQFTRAKENTKASPALERANSPGRDSPVLRLLWLLTGSSRRR
jgi:type IV secretory pathway TrbL component